MSGNYWLTDSGPGQSNWRWCRVCDGLFLAEIKDQGAIVAVNYVLTHQSGPGQQDKWFWCRGCQGLFFGGAGTLGVCPVNKNGHDPSLSGNYILSLTTG